ncbi:PREDICTED: ly6/PLAUR domain-containing protein 6-like isoform X2 [Priapulus caudatus]|uniref:Ly6/PLAUR domain-containing protein 6-like isoform X2 n=1 Tax=Priapulus caudatus TaxID=37621 RepID=A0ABM1EHC6_PRICU|nr:PREDICTED: ly6/PLAUR domain-containing protein 6-like isoform X2 [Priapulus caudatus]
MSHWFRLRMQSAMAYRVYVSGILLLYFTTEAQMVISRQSEEITCYTCKPKENNDECNKIAIDVPCPKGTEFCQSMHRMDVETGASVYMHKFCAKPINCTEETVGCKEMDAGGLKLVECVSCCDESYCNRWAPTNHTNAILQSSNPANSSPTLTSRSSLFVLLLCCILSSLHTSIHLPWIGQ